MSSASGHSLPHLHEACNLQGMPGSSEHPPVLALFLEVSPSAATTGSRMGSCVMGQISVADKAGSSPAVAMLLPLAQAPLLGEQQPDFWSSAAATGEAVAEARHKMAAVLV